MAKRRPISTRFNAIFSSTLATAAGLLASRPVRGALIGAGAVAAGYLVYHNVWQPLQQPVGQPPGVSAQEAQLDAALLKAINTQRVERVQHPLHNYSQENALFAPAVVATP